MREGGQDRLRFFVGAVAVGGMAVCLTYAQKPVKPETPQPPTARERQPSGLPRMDLSGNNSRGPSGQPETSRRRTGGGDFNAVNTRQVRHFISIGLIGEALRQIAGYGNRLNKADRRELVLLAMNELAKRIMSGQDPDPAQKLAEAQQYAPALKNPNLDAVLNAVAAWLAHQSLLRDLQAVGDAIDKRQWAAAAHTAQTRLHQADLAPEMKTSLLKVVEVSRQLQGLEQVRNALQVAERNQLGETAVAFRAVHPEALSPEVQRLTRGLHGLTEAWAAGNNRERPPNDQTARDTIARLTQGFADWQAVAGNDPLPMRMQADLAVKWFLDGFPEAQQLVPESPGQAEHARALLQDLKALALGKGKVCTWPAQQALQRSSETADDKAPTPPPGVAKLLPANQLDDWRPPGQETPEGRRSALEESARREKPLREQLETALLKERERIQGQAEDAQDQVQAAHQQYVKREEGAQQVYEQLEAQTHKLTPAEQALAWHSYYRGQKAPDITKVLDQYQAGRLTPDAVPPAPSPPATAGRRLSLPERNEIQRLAGAVGAAAAPGRSGLTVATDVAARLANPRSARSGRPSPSKGATR